MDDTARKERIITHMNKSHQDSLSLFLQRYCKLPSTTATPSKTTLTSLSLNRLILTCHGQRYQVPFKPALSCMDEIRPRLKVMHQECLAALNLSAVEITSYVPPRSLLDWTVFLLVVATMVSFSRAKNFVPGSFLYETCGLRYVPGFARFCLAIQPFLIVFMQGIHLFEAGLLMARRRLRKYRVRMWSKLWWMWVGTCFIDGVCSLQRFDRLAREKEIELEKLEKS